ncbi:MAG TPA: Rne/Rng family ribonuclease [Candidatus Acidoferrales bacterium]|nr:Rne/Rng family ribonuclease [Candidatus Acidoferrales bacterium]
MAKEMVVSANPHETRVAILEDGQLCEIYVEREKEFALVGSIYKGRVTRVLPGMQSSFVDIGLDSDAFLYVTDFLQELEEFDHIVHTVEEKVQKMEDQGGQVFTPAGAEQGAVEPADVALLPGETINIGNAASEPRAVEGNAPAPRREDFRGRPGYENRPRENRGGYGRGGGGRDRGHGGRGRPGGHGGGGRDRGRSGPGRHGRELPASKYASHRPYEPPEQQGPTEPFESVLLPGESLSALKATPASESGVEPRVEPQFEPGNSFAEAPSAPETSGERETGALPEGSGSAETHAPEGQSTEETAPETRGEQTRPAYTPRFSRGGERDRGRRFGGDRGRQRNARYERGHDREEAGDSSQTGWATSLEPLPGESLSKAKSQEAANHEAPGTVFSAAPTETHEQEIFNREIFNRETTEESSGPAAVTPPETSSTLGLGELSGAHHSAELTEEEATALAEQVAEAQQEEAERVAEESQAAESTGVEYHGENQNGLVEEGAEQGDGEEHDDADETEGNGGSETSDDESGEHVAGTGVSEADAEAAAEAIELGEREETLHEATADAEGNDAQAQPMQARVSGDFRARMQRPARRGGRDRDRGRGRKPFRGHGGHYRGQPKRTQLISDLLKAGQEIIVQIAKEPLGKKGARITSHVALPGRFLVYMPTLDHTGVSRKIASAEERSRLRHLVTEAKGAAGGGFIVRTAAAAASPDEVRADVHFLTKTWTEIRERGEQRKAPSLLHRDLNLVERILRDYLSSDYTAIWVDSEEEYTKVLEFVSRFQPQLANRVKLFTKTMPIFEEFGIQQEIDKGLRPKVWLKSGGYIVINHTEALVAIDVNTGKFVGRGSNRLEDTIVRTNVEAVKEIVRQIRLRDLGGIIIIDFIDMEERRNREKVMAALEEALKTDRAPSKVLRFNEFGLVAITRKRTKQALERTLCQPCPYCTGSGMVKSIPTLCYEIQSEARKMAPELDAASLTLRVHPEIAKALKTRESSLMDELEQVTKKSVIIQADPTLHWEQYDIY